MVLTYHWEHKYANGPLVGLNNRIKNIKRSGYGYRNFYNLRARVLIVNRLFKYKKTGSEGTPSLPVSQVT